MTADSLSGGSLRRLRYVLPLLLVVLLALAPVTRARAAEGPCPPDGATPDVQGGIAQLLALVEQYRSQGTVPPVGEIEARLAQLFELVDFLLAESGRLTDAEVTLVLQQAEAAMLAEGVPPQHAQTAVTTLGSLLNAETPPTAEQALQAIFTAITPYLTELGFTAEQITFVYQYLLQFLPKHEPCPTPAPTPQPTATATAAPVVNATPTPPATSTAGALANTGIDPILLLGVVAIAMIAGGLALEAGQRRPARHRDRRR